MGGQCAFAAGNGRGPALDCGQSRAARRGPAAHAGRSTAGPTAPASVAPGPAAPANPPSAAGAPYSAADPPFSFVYGGTQSAALLKEWPVKRETCVLDARRTRHTLAYADPKTGLVVRWAATEYRDFPTVEWTLAFKNEGQADTPLLSEIQAVDTRFQRGKEGEFTLYDNTGSPAGPNDYEPHARPLGPRATERIATSGGRSTNSNMPYFNVEWPRQGVIVVLGWPGQWSAEFTRDDGAGLRVRGGQELTRFKLHPGEEVRSPLAVLQFWKGDWIRIAERLAALDGGAQSAPARRKTHAPGRHGLPQRFLSRHEEQCRRRNSIYRSLRKGGRQARLLVDRRRLVSLRHGLGERRHLGARSAAIPQRAARRWPTAATPPA